MLYTTYPSGNTVFALIRCISNADSDAFGEVWYSTGMEVWGTDGRDVTDYAIALSANGGNLYSVAVPALPVGNYLVEFYVQDGGTPNLTNDGFIETKVVRYEGGSGSIIELLLNSIKAQTDNLPADPASETNVDANETKIDTVIANQTTINSNVLQVISDIDDLNNLSTADILGITGITAGGSWTLQKALKVLNAWCAGLWRAKTGSSTIKELLDPDDGTTVILETVFSSTSPYVNVTVKI